MTYGLTWRLYSRVSGFVKPHTYLCLLNLWIFLELPQTLTYWKLIMKTFALTTIGATNMGFHLVPSSKMLESRWGNLLNVISDFRPVFKQMYNFQAVRQPHEPIIFVVLLLLSFFSFHFRAKALLKCFHTCIIVPNFKHPKSWIEIIHFLLSGKQGSTEFQFLKLGQTQVYETDYSFI